MGAIYNWLKNWHKAGDPARSVPGVVDANRIANILQDIQGVGCRIEKPTDRDGYGWRIVADGSSDIDTPTAVTDGRYWANYTQTGVTETGEFKTTGGVVIGTSTSSATNGRLIVGNNAAYIEMDPTGTYAFLLVDTDNHSVELGAPEGPGRFINDNTGDTLYLITDASSGYAFEFGSIPMIATRQSAIADVADTTGTDSDGTARAKINDILALLRTHNLIDT